MSKLLRSIRHMAFLGAALVVLSLSPFLSSSVIAQSPMDMMKMMTGGSGKNETGNGMMMEGMLGGDSANMSMRPIKMGVLAMPMMCTTPAEVLASVSTMFGALGADRDTTEQMMMEMLEQQMPSGTGSDGIGNITNAELQQSLDMVVCLPMMDEKTMEGMMGGSG